VLTPAPFGGLERVVHTLARGQLAAGADVQVFALLSAGAPVPMSLSDMQQDGIPAMPVELPSRAYHRQLGSLVAVCASHRPDVVHTHGYVPDVLARFAADRLSAPLVSTVHGFTGGDWRNRLYEWMQRRSLRRFDAVVAVSRKMATELAAAGVPDRTLRVIPNAWSSDAPVLEATSARAQLGVPDNSFSVGWVGRISPEKGLDVLVDALPSLADLPLTVTVVGDGPERAPVERRAIAHGVARHISWTGAISGAARFLRAFDVLVLSSRTEGTPMILLEAMHADVPVIATAVGGVPDVVSPSEALLVPSNDPAALSAAIRAVNVDRQGAATRARSAASRLQRDFAVGPWVERYEEVYRSLMIRRSAGVV
jgi:glycosyltransferase involved in cell wall biosynthesis